MVEVQTDVVFSDTRKNPTAFPQWWVPTFPRMPQGKKTQLCRPKKKPLKSQKHLDVMPFLPSFWQETKK